MDDGSRITRRQSLARVGALAGTLVGGAWVAEETGTGPAAVASGAVRCVLTPEQTEGPFYIPGERVRRDIREGRPGAPLLLRLSVVDASTCRPVRGAAVDVWHCDALGVYSGVASRGGTRSSGSASFLRGIQRTDTSGLATFQTVYPGWYQGRAVHIHVKVHLGGSVVHTGQLYFPDPFTDAVYRKRPYNTRPGRDTRNADDAIYRNGGSRSLMSVRREGGGYLAAIAMGVHRS